MAASEAKSGRLHVRLAPSEHAELKRRAESAGMSASEYVRRRCLEDSGNRPVVSCDIPLLRRLYADMRHAGGNLNQIARLANSRKQSLPLLEEEVLSAAKSVAEASAEISKFIEGARSV